MNREEQLKQIQERAEKNYTRHAAYILILIILMVLLAALAYHKGWVQTLNLHRSRSVVADCGVLLQTMPNITGQRNGLIIVPGVTGRAVPVVFAQYQGRKIY